MGTKKKALTYMVPVQRASERTVSGADAGSLCAGWLATFSLWAATLLLHLPLLSCQATQLL